MPAKPEAEVTADDSGEQRVKSGPAVLESVAIVFQLLDELSAARRPLGVTELAALIGEPKTRVYRHLASMRRLGSVEQETATEKYQLGSRLVAYGAAAAEQFDLSTIAAPYLTRLRDTLGQSAVLSVATNNSALVISAVDSRDSVYVTVKPGNRVPIHCSAQGRIVLAFMPEAERKRLLRSRLESFTPQSIVDPATIAKRLAIIRDRLIEEAAGEVIEGVNVIAAPILRDSDALVGSIGIIGPASKVPSPPPQTMLLQIQSAAAALSGRLGSNAYCRLGFGTDSESTPRWSGDTTGQR